MVLKAEGYADLEQRLREVQARYARHVQMFARQLRSRGVVACHWRRRWLTTIQTFTRCWASGRVAACRLRCRGVRRVQAAARALLAARVMKGLEYEHHKEAIIAAFKARLRLMAEVALKGSTEGSVVKLSKKNHLEERLLDQAQARHWTSNPFKIIILSNKTIPQ